MSARTLSNVVFLVFLLSFGAAMAQLSRGGTPLSFTKLLPDDIPTVTTGRVDVAAYLAEDEIEEAEGLPFRFGAPFDVDYDFMTMAAWHEFADGSRVGRLRIASPDAYSINLIYRSYHVPQGALFFVYSADQEMVIGAFDSRNNKEHGQFATRPVKGDEIVLEYFEPADVRQQGTIVISRIVHGYKNMFNWDVASQALGFGSSGSCNNNVNCPEGEPWQREKRGVAMVLLSSGTRWCSGSMINNTRQDETAYFLTANHCLGGEANWIFMFNYESPSCANIDGPTNMTLQGSTLLASYSTSDFGLVLLDEAPPDSYYVYYNGWARENNPSTRSTGIHHPSGDIKKISFDYDPVTSANYLSTTGTTHWRIGNWEDGTTEGGSSGSPLFDQNHRIIGQLHGGYASCTSITADWYGKLYMSWSGGGSSSNRLSNWLDPLSTGVTFLDGYDPFAGVAITHTPLEDTRDTTNDYMVVAEIESAYDLVPDSLLLIYEADAVVDTLTLTYTGLNADYSADIPAQAPGTDISYHMFAKDVEGNTDTTEVFAFSIIDFGLDVFTAADSMFVAAYDTAWFDLTVVNTGLYADSYQFDLSGNNWTATIFN
ncbi:MAG: trypsin-like peptidase domain-containing protein, partial [bacterium]